MPDAKLFVKGISERVTTKELRNLFEKYGRVIEVKTGQAGFAFVEMADERDCYEAIRALDNSMLDGAKITVEKARGRERSDSEERHKERGFRKEKSEFLCYNCNQPGHLARDCTERPRNPMYVDTRGTRVSDLKPPPRRHDSRWHPYGDRDRERDRFGRDEYPMIREHDRDYYRDRYDRYERERDSHIPRDDRLRDYDRYERGRSPPRYERGPLYDPYPPRDPRDYRGYSPDRGRSPDRGYASMPYLRGPLDHGRRSRSPPDRIYRNDIDRVPYHSRSPPRGGAPRMYGNSGYSRARTPDHYRPRSPGERPYRGSGRESPVSKRAPITNSPLNSGSAESRRTPPDTL